MSVLSRRMTLALSLTFIVTVVLWARKPSDKSLVEQLRTLTRLDYAAREEIVARASQFDCDQIRELVSLAQATESSDSSGDARSQRIARYIIFRTFPHIAKTVVANIANPDINATQILLDLTKIESDVLAVHKEPYTPSQTELLYHVGAFDLACQRAFPHQCISVHPCRHEPMLVSMLWQAGKKNDAIEMAWRLLIEHHWDGMGGGYAYDGIEQAEEIFISLLAYAADTKRVEELAKRAEKKIANNPDAPNYWMHQFLKRRAKKVELARGIRDRLDAPPNWTFLEKITGYIDNVPDAEKAKRLFEKAMASLTPVPSAEWNELLRIEYPALLDKINSKQLKQNEYKYHRASLAAKMYPYETRKCVSLLISENARTWIYHRLDNLATPQQRETAGAGRRLMQFEDWKNWLSQNEDKIEWPDKDRWW